MYSFRPLLRRRVLVNLTTGTVLQGVLWSKRGPIIVLRDAKIIIQGSAHGPRSMDGEVVVERSMVEFMQFVSTPAGAA